MYSEQDGSKRQQPANNGERRDLYAATSPSTRAIAARSLTVTSGERSGVVGFKAGERRIDHFPARHEDDVESRWRFPSPEQLAGETFGPVPDNSGANLPCGCYTESAPVAAV
jgi:hypothetical protein